MDSFPNVPGYELCAKRRKFNSCEPNAGDLCHENGFSLFSTSQNGPIDATEAPPNDCDSGYEASNLESFPTPSHNGSPQTPRTDNQESLSGGESFFPTPTHTDTDNMDNIMEQLEGSQDSLEEPDDDNASTVSNLSDVSGLSEMSGHQWRAMSGSMIWVQQQMQKGVNPRSILSELGVEDQIPEYLDDITLWKLIVNMLAEPPRRNKLRHVNTLDDVVRLLKGAQNIIVLTGAGVSVSCGIPDFRSRDGIYSRLAIDFPNLPDPQAMFDISFFSQDPRPFFKFARDIYPGKFEPSPCHRFIKLLENQQKLLRNYTQNIDTLEKEASIERVIECHGSFATATCTKCEHKVSADKIRDIVLAQKIPLCEVCHPDQANSVSTDELPPDGTDFKDLVMSGVMKPDIVFFGEGLPETFHEAMAADKSECDLLLVIGSSLKVRPVALIPSSLPAHVPQILINREPLPHCHFDVELLGDCDVIVNHLCQLLGVNWEKGINSSQKLTEATQLLPYKEESCFNFDKWPAFDKSSVETSNAADETITITTTEETCKCRISSVASSSTETEVTCTCQVSIEPKIESEECTEQSKCIKERHISIDSTRDSGFGENSNLTDIESESNKDSSAFQLDLALGSHTVKKETSTSLDTPSDSSDMRGFWQPKVKKSLADRLPPDSYHLVPPSRYIFPGAEVFYDPDARSSCRDDRSSSDSSDVSDSEIN